MICLYLDHSECDIDRNIFNPVLARFGNELIEPYDIPPDRICELQEAIDNREHILAFVHTALYEDAWLYFASANIELVQLVLLSRNPDQFAIQGQCPDYQNVWCFAPADRTNNDLIIAINNLS